MKFLIVDGTFRLPLPPPETAEYTEIEVPDDAQEITVPHGVRIIARRAFSNFISLRRVYLPDTLESIQLRAFENCPALERLHIPDSVRYLGASLFTACPNLRQLIVCRHHIKYKKAFFGCRFITVPAFDAVPAELHRACAMGFAGHEEMYSDILRQKYLTYLRKNGSTFCKAAAEYEPLLHLMCRERLIKPQYVNQFLFHALRHGNVSSTAMLLEYKRMHCPSNAFNEYDLPSL